MLFTDQMERPVALLNHPPKRIISLAPTSHTDVRARVAAQHAELSVIEMLLREVTAMWTCGPAGGGGVRVAKRKRLSTTSCLINRELLPAQYTFVEPNR